MPHIPGPQKPKHLGQGIAGPKRPRAISDFPKMHSGTAAMVVCGLAMASHAAALRGGFVWLDHLDIEERAAIAAPHGWLALFTHGYAHTGFYRPLMALSLSIDALVGHPFVYHLDNLFWHALAALSVLFAAQAFGLSRRAALWAGAIFAVHPVTSLVACAIAYRSESMVTVCLLGLLVAHLRRQPFLAACWLLAGGLCKETALGLGPLLVAGAELVRRSDRTTAEQCRVHVPPIRLIAVEAGGLALALGLRYAFAPRWRAVWPALTLPEQVGTRLASLGKSAVALVAPVEGSICDAFRIVGIFHPYALGGLAIAGLLLWGAGRRNLTLLLALAIAPSLGIVPAPRFWSPHYLYIPLAFASMLAALGGERLSARVGGRVHRRAGITVWAICAILATVSLVRSGRFESDETLWTAEVKKCPQCREGSFYLGEADREAQRWDSAARHYEAVLRPTPGYIDYADTTAAAVNLGLVRLAQGRPQEAIRLFNIALPQVTDGMERRKLVQDLAAAQYLEGNLEETLRLLGPEIARPDAFKQSLVLAATALKRTGRLAEAQALINRLSATK